MSNGKVRVKINVKGVEIEIEASPSEIKEAISNVIKSMEELGLSIYEEEKREFYAATCKEAVENLWKEGWFEKPRRLSEVYEELSRRGYNFDRSAISHALASLAKEGILTRIGRERRYQYIQKIPYTVSSK
ncbi:hypothetical protein DRN84_02685 [Candidatus Geothermarchaeota archaeon]|nr:MAG: hypothetical protein DRN84_02685 [Candidatus Geothermarchaeota archaeon]HEW93492.1 hypothetical protein [Thermoprotei archaeon]